MYQTQLLARVHSVLEWVSIVVCSSSTAAADTAGRICEATTNRNTTVRASQLHAHTRKQVRHHTRPTANCQTTTSYDNRDCIIVPIRFSLAETDTQAKKIRGNRVFTFSSEWSPSSLSQLNVYRRWWNWAELSPTAVISFVENQVVSLN